MAIAWVDLKIKRRLSQRLSLRQRFGAFSALQKFVKIDHQSCSACGVNSPLAGHHGWNSSNKETL